MYSSNCYTVVNGDEHKQAVLKLRMSHTYSLQFKMARASTGSTHRNLLYGDLPMAAAEWPGFAPTGPRQTCFVERYGLNTTAAIHRSQMHPKG